MELTVIDYDMGNLRSLENALRHIGANVKIAERGEELAEAGHVILPGVGAFGASMVNLRERGFAEALARHREAGRPLMGICLGFQVLFEAGTERGTHAGLGFLPGSVDAFETDLHVPHVGWNVCRPTRPHALFAGLAPEEHMYFVHSYHPRGVRVDDTLATSDYGDAFVCAVARDNVVGTQFHPERSGDSGLRMLTNFLAWRP